MAGAGGIVATNHLFNVAAKDGTVIGGVQNNTPFEPLFGAKGPSYDPLKFNWLGTPSIEVAMLTVWHKAPVSTWQEAQKTEFTVGSSGVNSTPSFYGRLLNETLGLKQKIIVGYQSQTHAFLAMERGEVDGYPSVFYNSLMATRPNWLKDKMIKLLVQMGLEKERNIPDVPFALDLLTNPDDKLLSIAAYAPLQAGRPYLMPPGVPADRVAAMDTAHDGDVQGSGVHRRSQQARHGRELATQRGGAARSSGAGVYQDPGPYRPAAAEDFDALSGNTRFQVRPGDLQ